MKSRPEWSKLSSAQLSTATPCAGRPYQLLRLNGNSAVTRRAGVVAEVVPADLAVVVRRARSETRFDFDSSSRRTFS